MVLADFESVFSLTIDVATYVDPVVVEVKALEEAVNYCLFHFGAGFDVIQVALQIVINQF